MAHKAGYAGWMNEWEGRQTEMEKEIGKIYTTGWADLDKEDKRTLAFEVAAEVLALVEEEACNFVLKAGTKYVAEGEEKGGDYTTEEWKDLNLQIAKAVKEEMEYKINKIENGNW